MRILFVPTWKCNLQCSYCSLRTTTGADGSYQLSDRMLEGMRKDKPVDYWLSLFEKLPASQLELTGGDPTMYEGLVGLIAGLPSGWTWSITSNTLRVEVVQQLDLSKCLNWTASYHYHSGSLFNAGLLSIKKRGLHPSVTLVVTPEKITSAYLKARELSGDGYRVNIHRALLPGFSWKDEQYTDLWNGFKRMLQGLTVNIIDNIPMDYTGNRYSRCKAGRDYMALGPEGNEYRCFAHLLAGQPMSVTGTPDTCKVDCVCSYDIDNNKPER